MPQEHKHEPLPGFVKVAQNNRPAMSKEQRAALIRRGNELFNSGRYEDAKRVFLTVGYSDGLSRLGDIHKKKNEPLEAFRMYWQAPDPNKTEPMIEKMAQVLRHWLVEDSTEP
jgi:hypothetical protein